MTTVMNKTLSIAALCALACGTAAAKLPPLSDEAKAKAAEAAAKTAHAGKVEGFLLCKSMDRVAVQYRADAKKAGKEAPAATETPACADPGPFVPPGTAAAAAPAPTAAAAPAKK